MGFPTKNDHFGVFWRYHHFRKPPNEYEDERFFVVVVVSSSGLVSCRAPFSCLKRSGGDFVTPIRNAKFDR